MWRQGDILIESVESIPDSAKKLKTKVIAASQGSGNAHRIQEKRVCRLFSDQDQFFLDVFAELASLVHPEHGTIELKKGLYRVWHQRELTTRGSRRVWD